MTGSPRALIVYQHLPHYRYGVFVELQRSTAVEYEFAADTSSRDGSIPTVPADFLHRFHRLTNRWYGSALWQSGLVSLLLRHRYDAVVFLGDAAYVSTWIGAALCRLMGCRVLYWTIGWHRPDQGIRRFLRLAFYRLAHGLLLYGNVGRKIGQKMGYPEARMRVIGNSHASHLAGREHTAEIDLDELERSLPRIGTDVVTAVVRQNAYKRLDLLVRAAARLREWGRTVTVLLVGTGPERENLRRLAADLGADVRLIGPVYSDRHLELIYQRTRLTVVPNYAGLTSFQSLKHGRPVVTSNDEYRQAPESECIRPGETGGYYADGSVDSLAESIAYWLDRMGSEESAIASACRAEISERWSPQRHSAAINSVVIDVVRQRSGSR